MSIERVERRDGILEEPCPTCQGSGAGLAADSALPEPCPRCEGRGKVLTPYGNAVISLVKRYIAQ